ncbi:MULTISPECIES: Cof-type HAD-IIB family hydrolase [Exiguobacterium]|uniref:Cof-type HAD-IIB family hydrolase n=1 Tax=Exiguobacterium TaxID=33986 RepID=UPI001BEC6F3A|nr:MULTISPECIES: Cof-type HAD-IIB family hydrolase [Exiguobacterium]MCT4783396.1 Cof-type HAD-IIB family hydrolase [Exiguobacterium himgiriensis]
MQKIIFLDVDGTLVDEHGNIPESAKEAVQKARQNGHLVFLSTGRSKAELFPDILDVGFDGIIGAAGGYIELEEDILFHQHVSTEDLTHLVSFFTEHGIDFYLESNDGLYAGGNAKARIAQLIEDLMTSNPEASATIERGLKPFHDAMKEGVDLVRPNVNKISFLGSSIPLNVIQSEFASRFTVIPSTVAVFGANSGELSIPGINKATAIATLLEHLGLERSQTFAYGDGLNDIEMLEYVEIGVAMGNAKPEVKRVADDVTDACEADGLANSFEKYGLI